MGPVSYNPLPRFSARSPMGGFDAVFGDQGRQLYERIMVGSGRIEITQALTTVSALSGQTVVLGGILETERREAENEKSQESSRNSGGDILEHDHRTSAGVLPAEGINSVSMTHRNPGGHGPRHSIPRTGTWAPAKPAACRQSG